jgi:hypothetical protein
MNYVAVVIAFIAGFAGGVSVCVALQVMFESVVMM